ncbi:hypothetical protein BH09CHL1_BH09CHL1_18890 [soil metagenome]
MCHAILIGIIRAMKRHVETFPYKHRANLVRPTTRNCHNPSMSSDSPISIEPSAPTSWRCVAANDALQPPSSIASEHLPRVGPATHTLLEWTEYWISVPGAQSITASGVLLEKLPGGWFRLRLENQIGLLTLKAFDGANTQLVEPWHLLAISAKFPTIDEHERFYEELLDDLFHLLASLPFVVSSETTQQVREAMSPPEPLFALHFFTHEADRIHSALRTIQAMPHRTLESETHLVGLHAVSDIGIDSLLDILQSPHRWHDAPNSTATLARKLKGRMPTHVRQEQLFESLDTPENRLVLGTARLFSQSLASLRQMSWWSSVPLEHRNHLQVLSESLAMFLDDPKFRDVGTMTRIPSSSRVLLRRDGYRDLFALWGLFQQSRRPLFAALDEVIAVRDVASLYEMWVYFRLIDEIAAVVQEQPVLNEAYGGTGGLDWRSNARFGNRGMLRYNASRKAYSNVTLRPDMLWEPTDGPLIAFDAKFRLRHNPNGIDSWNEEDLVKMHAYRDALKVPAAVSIYPGEVSRLWPSQPLQFKPYEFSDIILGSFVGIGALAWQPR